MKYSVKTKLDVMANERDDFKCVDCGSNSFIETHHVVPGLEALDNLITLCHACHKKHHNMSGCFKVGYDERRGRSGRVKLGEHHPSHEKLRALNKTLYYNRWQGEWLETPRQIKF